MVHIKKQTNLKNNDSIYTDLFLQSSSVSYHLPVQDENNSLFVGEVARIQVEWPRPRSPSR